MAAYKDGERSVRLLVYSAKGAAKLEIGAVAGITDPAHTQHVFESADVKNAIELVDRQSSSYADGYRFAAIAYHKGQPAAIITDGPVPKEGELERLCKDSAKNFLDGKALGTIPEAKRYGFFEKKPKK